MRRVFVSLGNSKYNFDRLLNLISEIDRNIEVVVQIGYAVTPDKLKQRINTRIIDFLSKQEFEQEILNSTHCLGHAGIGFISSCIKVNRKPAVMCRLKQFNEHLNDHQLKFAEAYESEQLFNIIYEWLDLREFLENPEPKPSRNYINDIEPVVSFLNKEILKY